MSDDRQATAAAAAGLIPTYEVPAHQRLDPPLDPQASPQDSQPGSRLASSLPGTAGSDGGGRLGLDSPRRGIFGRRTSSSDGEPAGLSAAESGPRPRADAKEAAKVAAGLFTVLAELVAWLVQSRTGQASTLRKPTERQAMDVGEPLGRIAARHLPAEVLTGDVADGIAAGAAFSAYLRADDLIVPAAADSGVPAGINHNDDHQEQTWD